MTDESTQQPNVIIILADDMGYGDAGCFNPASKIPTQHLDAMAQNGMRFTNAHITMLTAGSSAFSPLGVTP